VASTRCACASCSAPSTRRARSTSVPGDLQRGAAQERSSLARSLAEPTDLLLWNEPLDYLDIPSREVETAVLPAAPTLVLVEHDRAFVERVATRRIRLQAAPSTGPHAGSSC